MLLISLSVLGYVGQIDVFSWGRNQFLFSHRQSQLGAALCSYVAKKLVQSIVRQWIKIFMFPEEAIGEAYSACTIWNKNNTYFKLA